MGAQYADIVVRPIDVPLSIAKPYGSRIWENLAAVLPAGLSNGRGSGRGGERGERSCKPDRPIIVADRPCGTARRVRERAVPWRREADTKGFVRLGDPVTDHRHHDQAAGLPRCERDATRGRKIVAAGCCRTVGRGPADCDR